VNRSPVLSSLILFAVVWLSYILFSPVFLLFYLSSCFRFFHRRRRRGYRSPLKAFRGNKKHNKFFFFFLFSVIEIMRVRHRKKYELILSEVEKCWPNNWNYFVKWRKIAIDTGMSSSLFHSLFARSWPLFPLSLSSAAAAAVYYSAIRVCYPPLTNESKRDIYFFFCFKMSYFIFFQKLWAEGWTRMKEEKKKWYKYEGDGGYYWTYRF
jgi:hypothetical protein